MTEPDPLAERPSRARWIWPTLLTLGSVALLVILLLPHRSSISTALANAPAGTVTLLTLLSLVALALRTETWRVALNAAGRHPPRADLHAANGGAFVVGVVNHYVAMWVKIWLLRRMEGERAARLLQLVAVDFAGLILEVIAVTGLVIYAAFHVAVAWWVPVLMLLGAAAMVFLALVLRRRYPDHHAVQGLSVLLRGSYGWRVVALLALVFAAQILRTWLALRAVGLDLPISYGVLVFVVTGVLGALPSGIAAAPTAASLIVLSSHGVGAAAGSGVLVTASLLLATVLYGAAAAAIFWLARRRRAAGVATEG